MKSRILVAISTSVATTATVCALMVITHVYEPVKRGSPWVLVAVCLGLWIWVAIGIVAFDDGGDKASARTGG